MSYGCGNHPLDGGFLRLSDAEVMSGECRSCNGGHFLRGRRMSTGTGIVCAIGRQGACGAFPRRMIVLVTEAT